MNESASVKSKPTRSPKLYYPMVLPPLVNNFRFPIQLIFHFIFSASPTFLLYQSTVTFLISFVFRYFFFCVQNTHPWFLNPWYIMEVVLIHLRIFTYYLGGPYLTFFRIWTVPPFRWSMFMSFLYCNFIITKQTTFVNTFLKIISNIFKKIVHKCRFLVFFVFCWNFL